MNNFHCCSRKLLQVIQSEKATPKFKIRADVTKYDVKYSTFLHSETIEFIAPFSVTRVIAFTCILEILTDIEIPVLLIEKQNDRSFDYYFIAFSLTNHKSVPLRRLVLQQRLDNAEITDGPNLVWTAQNSLFIGLQSHQNPSNLTEHLVADDIHKPKIYMAKYCTCHYLIFGKNEREGKERLFLFLVSPTTSSGQTPKVKILEVSLIISPLYTNLCAVLVPNLKLIVSEDDIKIVSSVYAVTNDGYILQFTNGTINFASRLNMTVDIWSQLYCTKCLPLGKSYLSLFAAGTLKVLNIENEKVVQSWNNVKHVLCDDFVGNGSEQLLILFEGFDGKSGFILTDMDILHIDKTADHTEQEERKEEIKNNTVTAVAALQSRLRNEIISLNELKSEIDQKRIHVGDLWRQTELLNYRNHCSTGNNPMLVNLIGQPENANFVPGVESENVEEIKVYKVWQRIIQKTWVVGVDIKNVSNKDFIYVDMKMMPCGENGPDVLTFISDCYDLKKNLHEQTSRHQSKRRKTSPASLSNFEHKNCYQLKSGKTLTVLCTTTIPSFSNFGDRKYELFVHLLEDSECEENCRNRRVIFIGEITLSPLDVVEGKNAVVVNRILHNHESQMLQATDLQMDILAMNVVQLCTPLLVRSSKFPLSQLQIWIQKKAGLVMSDRYECFIFEKVLSLEDARIYIDDVGDKRDVNLTVFTSCRDQLYLLLHHLYSVLPDDVLILPANRIRNDINQLIDSLQQEISSVCSGISRLYQQQQTSEDIEMKQEQDEKGNVIIDNVRQNFAKRKVLIQRKSSITLSGEELTTLSDNIDKLQLKSDISLIKLTSSC